MADDTLTFLTAEIAATYVANNHVASAEVATLIRSVYDALAGLDAPSTPAEPEFTPATTLRRSLADPTRIVSMIDGKRYASLKRHLASHGLTPHDYRTRYKLPADYPMVAPAYADSRRALAKQSGLGRKRQPNDTAPAAADAPDGKATNGSRKQLGIAAAKAAARAHLGEGE